MVTFIYEPVNPPFTANPLHILYKEKQNYPHLIRRCHIWFQVSRIHRWLCPILAISQSSIFHFPILTHASKTKLKTITKSKHVRHYMLNGYRDISIAMSFSCVPLLKVAFIVSAMAWAMGALRMVSKFNSLIHQPKALMWSRPLN